MTTPDYEFFMKIALDAANEAAKRGDVPVGALITGADAEILSVASNEKSVDPTAHAETRAIRTACEKLGSWNLTGCTLYVTLEPCPMCAGAIVLARVKNVVFGCRDPRAGACGTLYDIVEDTRLNHRCNVVEGVLANECRDILQRFFQNRRASR